MLSVYFKLVIIVIDCDVQELDMVKDSIMVYSVI